MPTSLPSSTDTSRRCVILTGLSGAGKTTALHALEDIGFYTVDNIPPSLWPNLVRQATLARQHRIAIGVDVRTRAFLNEAESSLQLLRGGGVKPEIIFLDAADDVLVKRYNFTRRTHPMGEAPLSTDITTERATLSALRAQADIVFDTSRTSSRELTEKLWEHFGKASHFRLRFVSFGFKHGVPTDADNVFDLRALPNPFYVPELRVIDGRDERVQAFVFTPSTLEFYSKMREFVRHITGMAQGTGRSSYTIAVGCTGGQHRSVAVAERLSHDLADSFTTGVEHRDVALGLAEHQPHKDEQPKGKEIKTKQGAV
ncbi:MAG: RNase adapter RapZ [Trueperaceae bacterium]